MKNRWESIEKVLLLLDDSSVKDADEFRSLFQGMNKQLLIVHLNSEKNEGNESSLIQLSHKDFNLIGKLKNESAQKVFQEKFDLLIALDVFPQKLSKKMKKIKSNTKLGLNIGSPDSFFDINMNTKSESPEHLINFTKEILEKIK